MKLRVREKLKYMFLGGTADPRRFYVREPEQHDRRTVWI